MRRTLTVLLVLAASCSTGGDDAGSADATTTTTVATTPDGTSTTPATEPVDELGGFEPEPLRWSACDRHLECATLTVPLDWSDAGGPTIDLAVTRIPASGTAIGGIAFNPGGPGARGNDYTASGPILDDELAEHFDTISWDPRGVGGSTPLGCDDDEVDDFVRLDMDPDSRDEQIDLDRGAQAVADHCSEEAPDELPFVGTDSVARDLEAIRRAYGAPMGYLGVSYGTLIGLRHLDLFPGRMDRGVVLDGVVDPEDSLTDLLRSQAIAFEATIAEILASCPSGSEDCPDGGGEGAYDALAARLEEAPMPVGRRVLGIGDLATAAIQVTYAESTHEQLLDGLGAAQSGDGSLLLAIADAYHDGVNFDLYQAVSCLDSVTPVGGDAWAAFADELIELAPRVGGAVANEMLPCAFWPVPPAPVTRPVVAAGSGPVVVLGTTGDPVTPVHQAEAVAAHLEDGRFVSVRGASHGAYFSSACAQEVVRAYFVDGDAPADGTTC